MLTETKKSKRPSTTTPYSFNSHVSAAAAESAVNLKFPEVKAYATERILFVTDTSSLVLSFAVEDFVKSLGGRKCSEL